MAVFNQVGFRSRKDKLAVGDVHLAAAKVDGIESTLDGSDDIVRSLVAGQHIRVGHTRHRDMLIALAAAVAGAGRLRQVGTQLVLDVSCQDAVFNQSRLLRRLAFVIHVDRTTPGWNGAIINHRANVRSYTLPNLAAEGGDPLAVEIRLQS